MGAERGCKTAIELAQDSMGKPHLPNERLIAPARTRNLPAKNFKWFLPDEHARVGNGIAANIPQAASPHFLEVAVIFRAREFDQPARHGQPHLEYPEDWVADRLLPLCEALELLRAEMGGQPIRVISGYRSEAYNVAVSGAKESQHLQGRAADIVVHGVDPRRVQAVVASLYQAGRLKIGGLGRYEGFTHVDVRQA